jgi:hypothetical protein
MSRRFVQAAVSKGGNTYISTGSANNLAEQILQSQINIAPTFSKHQGEMIAIWLTTPIDFSDSYQTAPGAETRNGETTLRHLLAPIRDVLDDPATTEVVVQRPGEVGIDRRGADTSPGGAAGHAGPARPAKSGEWPAGSPGDAVLCGAA